MLEGRVLYAVHDQVHVLRYVGDVRHTLAASVSAFVDVLFERMGVVDLVFDLTDTEAIDSTNLGEIARIADRIGARLAKRPAIVAARPEIRQVLFSMAFDEVFDIRAESPAPAGGEPIPEVPASKEVSLQIILAAHRRLMQMSEANRTRFTEVVDLMERELDGSNRSESDVRL